MTLRPPDIAVEAGTELTRSSVVIEEAAATFDLWVDSVNGSDGNSGVTAEQPLQTLAALVTAATTIGDGVRIAFVTGSHWREGFDLSSLQDAVIEAQGDGDPPIIDAFDVKTTWVNDAALTNLWYVDITHDASGSARPVVLDNGLLMSRAASAAAANGGSGRYYSADAGSANPLRVYINPGSNPNSNGHTYEVTVRNRGIKLGVGGSLTGIAAKGALSSNGPIEAGQDTTIRRCVAAYGTKHTLLQASGVAEDVVLFENDAPTASEISCIPFVAYAPEIVELYFSGTRIFCYSTHSLGFGSFTYAHSDASSKHRTLRFDQCIAHLDGTTLGGGFTGNAHDFHVFNSVVYGGLAFSAFSFENAERSFVRRSMGQCPQINKGGAVSAEWVQVALQLDGSGVQVLTGSAATFEHCSMSGASSYGPMPIGWVNDTGGSVSVNHCLIEAQLIYDIPAGASFIASDNNVYASDVATKPDGRFFLGVQYADLPADFASWQNATLQDANSVALASAIFTGDPSAGDFRVEASVADTGVTEHWNFQAREVLQGLPASWPVIPTTFADALAYIAAPREWSFYP